MTPAHAAHFISTHSKVAEEMGGNLSTLGDISVSNKIKFNPHSKSVGPVGTLKLSKNEKPVHLEKNPEKKLTNSLLKESKSFKKPLSPNVADITSQTKSILTTAPTTVKNKQKNLEPVEKPVTLKLKNTPSSTALEKAQEKNTPVEEREVAPAAEGQGKKVLAITGGVLGTAALVGAVAVAVILFNPLISAPLYSFLGIAAVMSLVTFGLLGAGAYLIYKLVQKVKAGAEAVADIGGAVARETQRMSIEAATRGVRAIKTGANVAVEAGGVVIQEAGRVSAQAAKQSVQVVKEHGVNTALDVASHLPGPIGAVGTAVQLGRQAMQLVGSMGGAGVAVKAATELGKTIAGKSAETIKKGSTAVAVSLLPQGVTNTAQFLTRAYQAYQCVGSSKTPQSPLIPGLQVVPVLGAGALLKPKETTMEEV
jgi:hypothetical protein